MFPTPSRCRGGPHHAPDLVHFYGGPLDGARVEARRTDPKGHRRRVTLIVSVNRAAVETVEPGTAAPLRIITGCDLCADLVWKDCEVSKWPALYARADGDPGAASDGSIPFLEASLFAGIAKQMRERED